MDRLANGPKGRAAFANPRIEYWNVPLIRNSETVEQPANQLTITRRYTEEAIKFMGANKNRPFFVYFPHTMPHVPLFRSSEFAGHSARGLFGDVIEEIDWSVGQVMNALRRLEVHDNTIVWFTSDNGPWLIFNEQGGSAGLLREGKGSTWEGGMREPTLAWWPGRIPAGTVTQELGSTMDIFSTSIKLAGGVPPTDRIIDGVDLSPVLFAKGKSPRDTVFYYRGTRLMAVRHGSWKAHFITQSAYGRTPAQSHDPPELYHLGHDPSEKHNVAQDHADVIAEIKRLARQHQDAVRQPPSQLEIPISKPK